ncbi:MAG: glycosyltransferase [Bacteroidetes bacterium]|nr:glycosyltransferase [Fibrella sp.]
MSPSPLLVSLLIAARNEEATILSCLRAVSRLDYPTDRLEVLIGNDASTDCTGPVVVDFIADKPHFRLIDIPESSTPVRGKAHVLAQLASQGRGEFLFSTDADTEVPPGWITAMLAAFSPQTGIVTGVTVPRGHTVFHHLQALDWLHALTQTSALGGLGIPVTAMGNNMAVRRTAYDDVGGYENLPFSVTEDYALFRAVIGHGYGFKNLLNPDVLAFSKPVDSVSGFLQQRKRWMRGAFGLPVWMVLGLLVQYLAGPLLLGVGWFLPVLAVTIYCLKLLLQTLLLTFALSRLRQTHLLPYLLPFELYQLIIGPVALLYYILPIPVRWKGRQYG